jgi:hypothetical protein
MRDRLLHMQDRFLNEGWRIRFIPHGPDGQLMTFGYGENIPGRMAGATGAIALVAGVASGVLGVSSSFAGEDLGVETWFKVSSLVFIAALVALVPLMILARIMFRRSLRRTLGTCVDRELRCVQHPKYNRESWGVRLLCRYTFQGRAHTGTPYLQFGAEQGMDFRSREAAEQFLVDRVATDGTCWLLVDPRKPLRAYLL